MKKILIVDDDVRLLSTMRRMLEATREYEVMTEDSGRRALTAAVAFKPDLIILDINMPEMGGLEFLREISTSDGKLRYPVLVMTARANMAQFFDNVAVDGFVSKPCDPEDLRIEVNRILFVRHNAETSTGPDPAADTAQKRILIGEDDTIISQRLIDVFRRAGYVVDCVSQGPHMLEEAIVRKPDVILLKLVFSNLNGDAVARMLKGMPGTKDIPIVLYDQDDSRADQSKFTSPESGIRKYVKSDSPHVLLSAVSEVLGG